MNLAVGIIVYDGTAIYVINRVTMYLPIPGPEFRQSPIQVLTSTVIRWELVKLHHIARYLVVGKNLLFSSVVVDSLPIH